MLLCHLPLPTFLLLLLLPTPPCDPLAPPPAALLLEAPPLPLHDTPFTVVWNLPTDRCHRRHGVRLPLASLGILSNPGQRFQGQTASLFYRDRLGRYPYLTAGGHRVNGGVPQRANLQAHLSLARAELSTRLRPGFGGVAVLDWEEWRPLWVRDFGAKAAYRRLSRMIVRRSQPWLSAREVTSLARREFERGARELMAETLSLGAELRPGGFWGFYGFPSCYNNPPGPGQNRMHAYTGRCHPRTRRRNDQLAWLWQRSSALYPSIYVPRHLAGSPLAASMVRHRLLEALRVVRRHGNATRPTPILPYARLAFTHTLTFLNQTDLDHTLGESAALGAAGVVLWGELSFARSKGQCQLLRDYLVSVLGRYITTLRDDITRCSLQRCHGNGRCVRRDPLSDHMIPSSSSDPGLTPDLDSNFLPDPGASHRDLSDVYDHFLCQCYQGWTGDQCHEETARTSQSQHVY